MFKRVLQTIWRRWLPRGIGQKLLPGFRKQLGRLRLCLEQLEDRTAPSVLTVNSVADNTTSDTSLTLREAILVVDGTLGRALSTGEQGQVSGALGTNDTIQFNLPSGLQTITLASTLPITKSVTITGTGIGNLTVSGNNAVRVFLVGQSSANLSLVVNISDLTISGGSISGSSNYGGGLRNFGALTVSNVAFSSNSATAGGAIANDGTLTVNSCTFTGNSGVSDGGAIYNYHSVGTMTVTGSTFTNNTSNADGGAIRSNVKLALSTSTFTGNFASSQGGGLSTSDAGATVSNCTFANNSAGSEGGGIMIENISSAITLVNNTVTGNRAKSSTSGAGGGIRSDFAALLRNNLVAGNVRGASGTTADDIGATVDATSSFNLIGTGGSGGLTNAVNNNQVGVSSPKLGTLANNGGPTQTVALLSGSPAIDTGSNVFVTTGETDQRGFARIANGTVDIGAFEVQAMAGSFIVAGYPSPVTAGSSNSFTVTAKDNSNNTITNYTGTVHFTSSDSQAVLPADYTFVSGDNGVHTFSATLKTAASQTLIVTDVTGTMTGTQSGIVVNPAAASILTVAGFPSPSAVGTAGNFTVTAKDAYNNTATGYTGTVKFTSSDSKAVLPPNYPFVSGDHGVHTFSATLKTIGTQSLTASDTTTSTITGTQTGIVVSVPAVLTVNSTADNTTADSFLTLREAIALENGNLGRALTSQEQAQITGTLGNNDIIQFNLPAGPQTITLGSALSITHPIAITGPGAANLTISGNNASRVFVVGTIFSQNLSLVVAISGLTVSGGSALTGSNDYGAGILNFGTLTVSNCTIANNAAGPHGGGGIYNDGALTVSNTTFSGNSVASVGAGGGIFNISAGTVTVTNSTFTNNNANGTGSSAASGGAISNSGMMTVSNSTFSGNFAASDGGGIYNDGNLTVTNSSFINNPCNADGGGIRSGGIITLTNDTFTGNTATSVGGGIDSSDSSIIVTNCTFTNNSAGSAGGGIDVEGLAGNAPPKLLNTLVAGNFQKLSPVPGDINGSVDSSSAFNLIGTGGSGGLLNGANNNQVGVSNPGLGSLASNGGPTQTFTLLPGSPAIDQGSNAFVTSGTDQRGFARVVNGTVDIGALEVQMSSTPPADQNSTTGSATAFNLGSFADANSTANPWSVDVNWGDLSTHTTFTTSVQGALGTQTHTYQTTGTFTVVVTVTDANHDSSQTTFHITIAAVSKFLVAGYTNPATAGVAGTITVTAQDGSGNVVIGYQGAIHFTSNDIQAGLPSNYTFVSGDNGAHTFNVTLKTAGSNQSITVTDTANSLATGTQSSIVVNPAAASKLVVATQPSTTATAGVAFVAQPVVAEEDGFGNIITSDSTNTVTAASTGTALLQGTTTVTLSGGMATFSALSYNKAETITLNFTGAPSVTPITSGNIAVSPAAASQLVITTQPSTTAIAGVAFAAQPVVAEEDGFGNIITSDMSHTVSAASTGTAVLQGTTTLTLSGGLAAFGGLSYKKAETITLSFSTNAPTLGSVASGNIVVSPASASQLVITTQPSTTATAGVAFAAQPALVEEDSFGNILTSDNTHTVTAASTGSALLQGTTTVTLNGGVATFSGLSYNKAETITLSFSSNAASVPAITSGNIAVSPASASKLAMTTQPSTTAAAGVAFATQPSLAEEDNFGNIITTDSTNTVTAASTGTALLQGTTTVTLSGGVATFSGLSYNKAETITLGFITNAPSVTPITSGNIVVNPAAASQLVISTQPSTTATAGVAFSAQPVLVELDSFGNILTNDNSQTVTAASTGTAALQGITSVTVSGGVATFSGLSYNKAKTITLSFSSNAASVPAITSGNIAVSPASASKLAMTTQPSTTATAGVAFATQPSLAEEDNFGNIITTDSTNTVTAASTGTALLQGTTTVTLSGGMATFSDLSYNKAETITLSFITNAPSVSSVTSGNTVVSPASASQLVITTQPSTTAMAGVAFAAQPVLAEEDNFGNIITNDSAHTVTAASTGTASLLGTTTVTLAGGLATFADLYYDKAETITLSFSTNAAGVSSATSGTIAVSPGSSRLLVSLQPSTTAIAGIAFATQPIVAEEDGFGNIITSDSTNMVTAASTGTANLQGTTTVTLSSGMATFTDLSYNKAETIQISFSTNAPGVSSTTSSNIVVSPTSATQLVIVTQPSTTATAGVAFATQPVVAEEDNFGNIITSDSTNMVTAASTGTAAPQGTTTVILSGGVATFSGLSYSKAETITLSFSSNASGVSSAISGTIIVSPASASQLVITTQPSTTAMAGVVFATQPVLVEEDNFGNILTNDNSHMVTAASTGTALLQGTTTVTLSGGVATFSGLSYNKAETITLNFSTNAPSASSITSGNIVVSPALASKLAITTQPSTTATAGVAFLTQPVLAEEDDFGNIITSDMTHTVTAASTGAAVLQGITTVTLSSGVATFSGLSYNKAETITLSFSSNAPSVSSITSGNIVVSPASASKLAITTQPSTTATAGVAFLTQPVLVEEDNFGNIITNDMTNTVTAASTGTAVLQGTTTITLNNGVATFNGLSYNKAETITLSFSSNAPSVGSITSGNIVVSPAAAGKLAITTQPSTTATAGIAFLIQPVLAEEDNFGNLINDSASTVTAVSTGTALLQGTTTVTLSGGVATFSGLSYNKAETFTLSFITNAPLVSSITSGNIVVSPASASQLVITTLPSTSATAGVVFVTQPVLAEEDNFGNIITNDNSHTVTATRGSQGTAALQGSNLTFTLASGLATFSGLSYNKAETMNIGFSTNAIGVASIASGNIAVSPAAASILTVTGFPTPVAMGVAGSFTVTAQDTFGNLATGYGGTIHFTSSDGLAGLPLNSTLANGTGSFNATLNTGGIQSITATDTTTPSITGFQAGIVVATVNTILTVNTVADNTTADSSLSLREAIQLADGTLGRTLTPGELAQVNGPLGNNYTIQFGLPSGPQTITLTGGALSITKGVTISGPGAANLTINGNKLDRVFVIGTPSKQNLSLVVAIGGLTISGGSQTYGGGLLNFGTLTVTNAAFTNNAATSNGGGGVYNNGAMTVSNTTFSGNSSAKGAGGAINTLRTATLTVTNCTFSGNSTTSGGSGAAIGNSGPLTVTGTTFSANTSASNGGAISNSATATLTVSTSTFSGNSAASDGGGIDNDGSVTVTGCTFASNTAASDGGGLDSAGTILGVTSSTFFGNKAGSRGGAINSAGSIQVQSSTLTANRVTNGASGHYGGGLYDTVAAILHNTLIAGNFQGKTGTTANDIYGNVATSSSFNLIGTGGGGGMVNGVNNNLVGVSNPGLGTLASNGGPTQTVLLLPGSPAIDHGGNAFITSGQTDQRGFTRIVNGTVDIGAVEMQITDPPAANQSATANSATSFNLGSFTDVNDGAGPWSVNVNWGDGTAHTTFTTNSLGTLPTKSHSYSTIGTYTVTVTVTDANHDSSVGTFRVTVSAALNAPRFGAL